MISHSYHGYKIYTYICILYCKLEILLCTFDASQSISLEFDHSLSMCSVLLGMTPFWQKVLSFSLIYTEKLCEHDHIVIIACVRLRGTNWNLSGVKFPVEDCGTPGLGPEVTCRSWNMKWCWNSFWWTGLHHIFLDEQALCRWHQTLW